METVSGLTLPAAAEQAEPSPLPLNARKPSWLRAKIPGGPVYQQTTSIVREHKLHTVCESAQSPNLGECWSRKTATIMILGNICTRSCGFCAVQTGRPTELDRDEPRRVAEAIRLMGLRHAVITSVARDELLDGGEYRAAAHGWREHGRHPCRTGSKRIGRHGSRQRVSRAV